MALRLVEANQGVMFMSALEYQWHTDPGSDNIKFPQVKALHVQSPVCTRTIGIAYLKDHYVSPSARLFISGLKDFFR